MTTAEPGGEIYRDPDGNLITRAEWGALLKGDTSVVAVDEPQPGTKVCTYWIGIGDHTMMTIIDGGVLGYEQVGAANKAEALAIHAELVDRVKQLRTVWMGRDLTITADGPVLHVTRGLMRARIEVSELTTLLPALQAELTAARP